MIGKGAIVGAANHCGWAVLVTVEGGALIDRRRVELVDESLPKLPHHHEGQGLPLTQAVELVERVRVSANDRATSCLDELCADLSRSIVGIALRKCPALPDTVAERITNYSAQTKADSVMYREALAKAAEARGWSVYWYDVKSVFAEAAVALEHDSIDSFLKDVGRSIGAPWQKDHKTAMAAAIATAAPRD